MNPISFVVLLNEWLDELFLDTFVLGFSEEKQMIFVKAFQIHYTVDINFQSIFTSTFRICFHTKIYCSILSLYFSKDEGWDFNEIFSHTHTFHTNCPITTHKDYFPIILIIPLTKWYISSPIVMWTPVGILD